MEFVLNTKHQGCLNLYNVNIKLIERAYPNEGQYKNLIVYLQDAHYLIYQLDPTVLEYKFNRSTFTGDMVSRHKANITQCYKTYCFIYYVLL